MYKTMKTRRYRLYLLPYTNIIFTKNKPTERIVINSVSFQISFFLNFSRVKYNAMPPFPPLRTGDNVNKCILKVDSSFENQ